MTEEPLYRPSLEEIEQYFLPEETVRAMKKAVDHQETLCAFYTAKKAHHAMHVLETAEHVPPPKIMPDPSKYEATTHDQAEKEPKQDTIKQEMDFLKPIIIGVPILAVIFLAYFFTLILLVA